jgi:hypothetical protein
MGKKSEIKYKVIFVAKLLEVKQVADETANNYFMGIEIKH